MISYYCRQINGLVGRDLGLGVGLGQILITWRTYRYSTYKY